MGFWTEIVNYQSSMRILHRQCGGRNDYRKTSINDEV